MMLLAQNFNIFGQAFLDHMHNILCACQTLKVVFGNKMIDKSL